MTSYDSGYRLTELTDEVKKLVKEVNELRKNAGINELWDNSDMIRNWKVSARTLATWRADELIDYVQVGGKIWYPRETREMFLKMNFVKTKNGEDKDGAGN